MKTPNAFKKTKISKKENDDFKKNNVDFICKRMICKGI